MTTDAPPSSPDAPPARVFFGWWIVVAASLVQALQTGLLQQAYGNYVVELGKEFGWSKGLLSWGATEQQAVYGATGPGVGWLLDRFGPRAVIRVGMALTGVSFLMFARVDSMTTFFIALFVMSVGANMFGYIATTFVVIHWFERNRSRALSLAASGTSFGGMAVYFVALLIERYGWRTTSDITGLVFILAAIPVTAIMYHHPEDIGAKIDNGAPVPAVGTHAATSSVDFTLGEALRHPVFWWISFGHGSALFVVSAVNVHLVSNLTKEHNYSLSQASAIMVLVTAMYGIGTVTGGFIGGRGNRQSVTMLCMFMHMGAMLLLAHATNNAMIIVFALLHGYAWGWRGPQMAALRADYFGRASFGKIMGVSNIIIIVGTMLGPLIAGYAFDLTGSYRIGFDVLAGLAGLGSVFFYLSKPPAPPARYRVAASVEADRTA